MPIQQGFAKLGELLKSNGINLEALRKFAALNSFIIECNKNAEIFSEIKEELRKKISFE